MYAERTFVAKFDGIEERGVVKGFVTLSPPGEVRVTPFTVIAAVTIVSPLALVTVVVFVPPDSDVVAVSELTPLVNVDVAGSSSPPPPPPPQPATASENISKVNHTIF